MTDINEQFADAGDMIQDTIEFIDNYSDYTKYIRSNLVKMLNKYSELEEMQYKADHDLADKAKQDAMIVGKLNHLINLYGELAEDAIELCDKYIGYKHKLIESLWERLLKLDTTYFIIGIQTAAPAQSEANE